jgi:predicted nucleic acid-binding protein
MQLLVSDANILIDLEEGDLLVTFFQLPYEFSVPDILFYEELEEQHSHLLDMGLTVRELSPDTMKYTLELTKKAKGPSRNDCFAISLAKQESCDLLSGDKALRKLAEKESVNTRGTLWVVEQMIEAKLLSIEEAKDAYSKMKAAGRRLPWDVAFRNLTLV